MDDLILRPGDGTVEEVDGFLFGIERLGRELPGPLERRVGEVGPEPLQVGHPVRRARRAVILRSDRKGGEHEACGQQHESMSHCPDPFWYLPYTRSLTNSSHLNSPSCMLGSTRL